ncbi:MAG: hypothetical protein JNK82_45360 [Myxococcaceae bacterium]|nr:hypothetical protein [Myxococcaceae bacterium]
MLRLNPVTGQWADYAPRGDDALSRRFRTLLADGRVGDYDSQHEQLDEYVASQPDDALIESDEDAFPATLMVTRRDGRQLEVVVITETVDMTIPRGDVVVLQQLVEAEGSGMKLVGWVPWKRFIEVMKPPPVETWPPRWRVKAFPTAAQLKKLAPHPTLDDLPEGAQR